MSKIDDSGRTGIVISGGFANPVEWKKYERIETWHHLSLFGGLVEGHASMTDEEIATARKACLSYVIRLLSRGRIPDPAIVTNTMLGRTPVPGCGFLDCHIECHHGH